MEYKVLYRKYRPNCFEQVVGQDSIVETLKNSIINNKISHAYIFSGMRGTGKTSIAKIFAKTINCLNIKNGNSCDECANCNVFNNSPDILEIDAASNNSVENIREIISNCRLLPNQYKYKVYIIDEVHMLSTGAFNALLKTLEEPQDHVVFILATTDIQKVPATILSRCQRFDFNRIDNKIMNNYLRNICELEKIEITDNAINEISILSDGAMRDALSILEQLSKRKNLIDEELIEESIGSISTTKIKNLIEFYKEQKVDEIIELINNYNEKKYDISIVIKKLILILATEFDSKQMYVTKLLNEINGKYQYIMNSYNPYITLKIIIIDSLNMNDVNNIKTVNKEITSKNNGFEEKTKNETIIVKTTPVIKPIIKDEEIIKTVKYNNIDSVFEIRINNCFVNANKDYLKNAKEIWKKILSKLEIKNMKIFSIFCQTNVVLSSEYEIIISFISDSEVNLAIDNYDYILSLFDDEKYKIAFISNDEWNIIKNGYIKDIKNKIVYQIKDEPALIRNADDINKSETTATELFGEDSVDVI